MTGLFQKRRRVDEWATAAASIRIGQVDAVCNNFQHNILFGQITYSYSSKVHLVEWGK